MDPLPLQNPVEFPSTPRVGEAVARVAEQDPRRIAVAGDDAPPTSYRDLDRRSADLADRLRAAGCAAGDVVACRGSRSALTVALFLAIERLSAVYLPLDPDWPAARTAEVLGRAGAVAVVDHDGTGARIEPGPGAGRARGTGTSVDAPGRAPAYVIFTSGTTGSPKGAVVAHDGMTNHLWAKVTDLDLGPGDAVAFSAPTVFDISVWQMLAPLLVGARIVVVPDTAVRFPRRLGGILDAHGVSVLELVPTSVTLLLDDLARRGTTPAALRWLISTGEELKPALAARVLDLLPGVALLNAYGPTECSDDVTHHRITPADTRLTRCPVGRPVGNAVLYCLVRDPDDGTWAPAPPGETGELFVGGVPVGLGYIGDPERTREAFHRDTLDPGSPTGRLYRTGDLARFDDGVVHYLGRVDRQVKVDGVRMELDEIEAVLGRHPGVAQCAVTVGPPPRRRLTAHCVAGGVTPAELDAFLRERLPAPLVPRVWDLRTALPLTPNGKVDHRTLSAGPPAEDR